MPLRTSNRMGIAVGPEVKQVDIKTCSKYGWPRRSLMIIFSTSGTHGNTILSSHREVEYFRTSALRLG
jgi:hypothetical protein